MAYFEDTTAHDHLIDAEYCGSILRQEHRLPTHADEYGHLPFRVTPSALGRCDVLKRWEAEAEMMMRGIYFLRRCAGD